MFIETSCSTSHQVHCHVDADQCCQKKKSHSFSFISVIEKVAAVALGAFAAYMSWQLFIPSFFVGVCISAYSYIHDKQRSHVGSPVSACGHGIMEHLTGVKLPALVSLAAGLAENICHIEHHSPVFVPIIGVSVGAWIGNLALHHGDLLQRKVSLWTARPQEAI